MEEEGTQNFRLLKIIVATLGVLIVVMLGVIVVTALYRMNSKEAAAPASPAAVSDTLAVPDGSRLVDMQTSDREVYLHVRDAANIDHVYALDRRSGALLWHRQLTPVKP